MSGDGNLITRQVSKAELLHSPALFNLEHLKGRVAHKDWLKKLLIHFIEIKHLVKDSIEQPPMSEEYLRRVIAAFYEMHNKGRSVILIVSLDRSGAILHLNKAC